MEIIRIIFLQNRQMTAAATPGRPLETRRFSDRYGQADGVQTDHFDRTFHRITIQTIDISNTVDLVARLS